MRLPKVCGRNRPLRLLLKERGNKNDISQPMGVGGSYTYPSGVSYING
jgi:hypothetical protein